MVIVDRLFHLPDHGRNHCKQYRVRVRVDPRPQERTRPHNRVPCSRGRSHCAHSVYAHSVRPKYERETGNVDKNKLVLALRLNSNDRHVSYGSDQWPDDDAGSYNMFPGFHDHNLKKNTFCYRFFYQSFEIPKPYRLF